LELFCPRIQSWETIASKIENRYGMAQSLAKPGNKKNKCIYDQFFLLEAGFFLLPCFSFLASHPSPSAFLFFLMNGRIRKLQFAPIGAMIFL
jgi:hypothetical protein